MFSQFALCALNVLAARCVMQVIDLASGDLLRDYEAHTGKLQHQLAIYDRSIVHLKHHSILSS
jgi:hypothetical protein